MVRIDGQAGEQPATPQPAEIIADEIADDGGDPDGQQQPGDIEFALRGEQGTGMPKPSTATAAIMMATP
jgi:hypothetical protein